jgi:hypothetical protein
MVQCLVDSEGETNVTIGAANQVAPPRRPVFDRVMETPSRKIILEIVPGETVHEMNLLADKNRVRIWTDGRHQCARAVVIGVG